MNDPILTSLKILVERTVRPVRASTSCKLKMREELLAHVSAVYEEESTRIGDGEALQRTARRFGDPADLTKQLQESVPIGDRISLFFDLDALPGNSTLRNALPLARLTAAAALLIDVVGALTIAIGWWSVSRTEALTAGLILFVGGPAYAFCLGLLANRLERAFYPGWIAAEADRVALPRGLLAALRGPSGRSRLPLALLASALLLIVLSMAVAFFPPERWSFPATVVAAGVAAAYVAADSVILAGLFANDAAARRSRLDKWSRLPIEQ